MGDRHGAPWTDVWTETFAPPLRYGQNFCKRRMARSIAATAAGKSPATHHEPLTWAVHRRSTDPPQRSAPGQDAPGVPSVVESRRRPEGCYGHGCGDLV